MSGDHFVIMGINRPSSINLETFFDELADLFDAAAFIGGHKIFAGDFNCPGDSSETVEPAYRHCYRATTLWP